MVSISFYFIFFVISKKGLVDPLLTVLQMVAMQAIRGKDYPLLKSCLLMNHTLSTSCFGTSGPTLLHHAYWKNDMECMLTLLEHGAKALNKDFSDRIACPIFQPLPTGGLDDCFIATQGVDPWITLFFAFRLCYHLHPSTEHLPTIFRSR